MSSRNGHLNTSGTANKVKQHCQCWAKLVQAYIACPTAVEEQVKSGKVLLPGVPISVNDLEPAVVAFLCVTK